MKSLNVLLISFILLIVSSKLKSQVFFQDGFNKGIPVEWTQDFVLLDGEWSIQSGGINGEEPDGAYEGEYNVMFQQNGQSKITRLITPVINLKEVRKAQLCFGFAMTEYNGVDELTVECRVHADSSWVPLVHFFTEVISWNEIEVQIPDSLASKTTQISFKAKSNFGGGVCIDNVRVVETGQVSYHITDIHSSNFTNINAPSGSKDNLILRTIIDVIGNSGTLSLHEMNFVSKNSDDTDIVSGGVSLYYSKDTLLSSLVLISSGKDFVNGKVHFDDLNNNLTFGQNVFLLTYDLTNENARNRHNHILDAKIEIDGIKIEDHYFPSEDLDPPGNQLYKEALLFDDFENGLFWNITGDFEVDKPLGKGISPRANADPLNGVIGDNVLGTDLSEDGLYENSLPALASVAESKFVNVDYYKDLSINFWRWLNVEAFDYVSIEARRDLHNWGDVWYSKQNSYNRDNYWSVYTYDISDSLSYRDTLQVRFTLGPTDANNVQSGWNVDNFSILGDYVAYDVGVSALLEPFDGCGYGSAAKLKIRIENYGGEDVPNGIPVRYSINGNTWVKEIISSGIPIGKGLDYTFNQTADFSQAGNYVIRIETVLNSDEVDSNNRFVKEIRISPIYTIPYVQNFEKGASFWKSGGDNSTWMLKNPKQATSNPHIDSAYNGKYCWVTNYDGKYKANDSSYIESPCFDLTSSVAPILEFAIFTDFQTGVDGANVQYSIDNGLSWQLLSANAIYNVDWYSNPSVAALGNSGWDLENSGWFIVRNLLPTSLLSESSIRFRIVVASDDNMEKEGVAIDAVKIYEAPYNIGLTSLEYPKTNCELPDTTHVKIKIENTGLNTIPLGEKFPIKLSWQNKGIVVDTLILSNDLDPGAFTNLVFSKTVPMDSVGFYSFEITNLGESDPSFYGTNDNEIKTSVEVNGILNYNPFNDYTGMKNTLAGVTLNAIEGYNTYEWKKDQNVVTNNQFSYSVFVEGVYSVKVTALNGCTASDSTEVIHSTDNLELVQVITATDQVCLRNEPVKYEVKIRNKGEAAYAAGENIIVGFQVGEQPKVLDTIILSQVFNIDDVLLYTFKKGADLSESNNYKVSIFCSMPKDLDVSDDTLTVYPITWGVPEVAFLHDTIYTSKVDTLLLDAGVGMNFYEWGDGSTAQEFQVVENVSKWYTVTVNDEHGCGPTNDSVYVNTNDLGLERIYNPITACEHGNEEYIELSLQNFSGSELPVGTIIPLNVQINEKPIVSEIYELSSVLSGNSLAKITLETPFNFVDTGDYKISVWISGYDSNFTNDTARITIRTLGYPSVQFEHDTIFTLRPDTLLLEAGSQFNTYLWQDGSTNSFFKPDRLTSSIYAVTVTNNDGCGTGSDSIQVITYNLALAEINSPVSACELSENQKFKLNVVNNGYDIVRAGKEYTLSYRINEGPWISQKFETELDLVPGARLIKELSVPSDMSEIRRYVVETALSFELDASKNNDTIRKTIESYGYPEFTLNYSEINSTQPDTTTLIVTPSNFITYLWNVGENNDSLSLDSYSEPYYSVTVSDVFGCSSVDTVLVNSMNLSMGAILSPVNNCEHSNAESVTVRLYNKGTELIDSGISIQMLMTAPVVVSESFILDTPLNVGDSIDYTFTQKIDLKAKGQHSIDLSVLFDLDIVSSDNSISANIETYGYPNFTLNYTEVNSIELDTIILIATPSTYASYQWNVGVLNDSLPIGTFNQPYYSIKVSDLHGCTSADTVRMNTTNIGVGDILSPINSCQHSVSESVTVRLYNKGLEPIDAGSKIQMKMNSPVVANEILNLNIPLNIGDSIDYIFTKTLDLSPVGNHDIDISIVFDSDVSLSDNFSSVTVKTHGAAEIELGNEITINELPFLLDAGAGYQSYTWHDGSSESTFEINENNLTNSGLYSVVVVNNMGCEGVDSRKVNVEIIDWAAQALLSPKSSCFESETLDVVGLISNQSIVPVRQGKSFYISYSLNGGDENTEMFTLSDSVYPQQTLEYTFNTGVTVESNVSNVIELRLTNGGDVDNTNNAMSYTFTISEPNVEFGQDSIQPESFPYTLNAPNGFVTYVWATGETGQSIEVNEKGWYHVTGYDENGCFDTDSIFVLDLVGISKYFIQDLSVYPNPVKDKLYISLNKVYEGRIKIEIIDIQGVVQYVSELDADSDKEFVVDVSAFKHGVYLVKMISKQQYKSVTVVIQ